MTRDPLTPAEWDQLLVALGSPDALSTRWAAARVADGLPGIDRDLVLRALDHKASGFCASQAFKARGYVPHLSSSAGGQWTVGGTAHRVYVKASLGQAERREALDHLLAEFGAAKPLPEAGTPDQRADLAARRRGFRLDGLVDPRDLDPRHVVTLPTLDRPYFVAFRPLDPADPRVLVADGRSVERAMSRGLDLINMLARVEDEAAPASGDPLLPSNRHLPLRRAS